MTNIRHKNMIWLTVFLVYLASVSGSAISNNTTLATTTISSTASSSVKIIADTATNTSQSSPAAKDTTHSTSSSVVTTDLQDTQTSEPKEPTTTSTSTDTTTDSTTTNTPPTTTTSTVTPTTTTATSTSTLTTPTTPPTESSTVGDNAAATTEASTSTIEDEQTSPEVTTSPPIAVQDTTTSAPSVVTKKEEATSTAPSPTTTVPTTTAPTTTAPTTTAPATTAPTTTAPIRTTTELDYCADMPCEHNGTCQNSGTNYTCACTPGWQGPNCGEEKDYCKPHPCQHKGTCTQNLTLAPNYFLCECSQGITGPTCQQDVHECNNDTLCGHGACYETFGSYLCWCLDGWSGAQCEKDIDECAPQSPCPEYHRCNNTKGSFDCLCEDPLEHIDNSCQKTVLWPDFRSGSEFTRQPFYDAKTAIPFPYFESASRDLFVFNYGYVAFGGYISSSHAPYVPSQWPFSAKLFGVYWADIEATNSSKNPSHFYISLDEGLLTNLTYTSSLIEYVRNAINVSDFEPLSVLAATWVNAVPTPATQFPNDTATFQVIIATDGHVTYAVTGYRTVWENVNVNNRPYVQTAHSLENGVRSNVTTPGSGTGPVVVKLVANEDTNGGSNDCVQKTQNARIHFSEHLQSLPPCPCYQTQAVNDERFEAASSHPGCYHSTDPSPGSNLYQLCCFDTHGLLLNFTKEAQVPVDTKDKSLLEAYDQCCAEGSVLCDWFYTQIPFPGCAAYVPPFVGGGFGDPHIVTFDGNKYSFNDLGDFVLFQSGDTQFQGRTNVSKHGNTTLFVAYALKEGNDTYEFHQENSDVAFINGSRTTTAPEAKVANSRIVVKVTNRNGTLSYRIQLLSSSYPDSKGLLGRVDRNASNDFRFGDGTLKEGTAGQLSTDDINKFGESWRAKTSLFGENGTYPADFTPPELGTTPTAVLKQILEKRNKTEQNVAAKICGDELFCLQDYLIQGDILSAKDTLHEATDIFIQQDISKELPTFNNTQDYIQMNISSVLNLTLAATTHSQATFSFSSSFPDLAGLKLEGKHLTWNIGADLEALQNLSYPRNLVFYVTDAYHVSAEYAPIISLCLCNETSQCVTEPATYHYNNSTKKYFLSDDGAERGNVGSWICDCNGTAGGEFCQLEIDVCNNCFVKDESLCNRTLEDYCPPCPAGHTGNSFLCPDIDECAENRGGCQQICHNTEGSFQCGCNGGYRLSRDGKTCIDNNECADMDYCKSPSKYCTNDPGSAHCSCYPGLEGDVEGDCIRAPYTFFGSLGLAVFKDQKMSYALLVKSSKEFTDLAKKVSRAIIQALNDSDILKPGEVYVEVLSFENDTATVATNRVKRDTNSLVKAYTLVHFLIHTSNASVRLSDIDTALTSALDDCDDSCKFGDLLLFSNKLPKLDDVVLCSREDIHHCDLATTVCDENYDYHTTECKCKIGYRSFEMNLFSCYDIDECADNATLCGSATGACLNVPGTYQCDCGKGKVWNSSTKACVGDKCSTNPCENDGDCSISNSDQGYVCTCTYGWNGPVCADEDTDARRMKIAVICVSAILGFCCLALFVIVVVVCVKQRRLKNSKETSQSGGYSEIKSTSHAKVTQRDSNEMEENGHGNVYSRTSFERSSDKRTSFHTPVSETKKEGNANVFHNKAFENDVVARL